jgi:hypothetical protein
VLLASEQSADDGYPSASASTSGDGLGVGVGVAPGGVPGGAGDGGRAIVCASHLPSERQKSYWIAEMPFGLVSTRRSMLRKAPSPSRMTKEVSACPALPRTVTVSLTLQQSFGSLSLIRPRGYTCVAGSNAPVPGSLNGLSATTA